jgi:hypothetical protein
MLAALTFSGELGVKYPMHRSKNITDRLLLKKIYDLYFNKFCELQNFEGDVESQIHVEIECEQIAKELGLPTQLVFGRLYYHLEKRHRYQQDNGAWVHL